MTSSYSSFIIVLFYSPACFLISTQGLSPRNRNSGLYVMNDGTIVQESESSFLKRLGVVGNRFDPVISDPVVEDISWNSSVIKGLSRRDVTQRGLNHDSKMKLLQLHNLYRSNVTPPAGNMAYMEWDEELAQLAQNWSDNCVFEHGMPDNDYPTTIGQNLYLGSDPTGYLGLWMWFEEYLNYNIRKHSCLPGKQCGHYQQMVWARSDRVGCGITKCDKLRYILTCHYRHQALRGVQIYEIAKPCSQCSSKNGGLCLKNLCMTWDQCKQNPFECQFARCDLECHNCGRLDTENCLCECTDGWDSPDCSRICTNKNARCGQKPGFPKESCFLYSHVVAEDKCRMMCEMCNPINTQISNDTCCDGTLCDDGSVLDQSCKCQLLCPGPTCDGEDEAKFQASLHSGVSYLTSDTSFIIFAILVLFFTSERTVLT